MAYTLDQGYQPKHGLDRLQRGLLIGLPALALLLSLGTIIGRHNSPAGGSAGQGAKQIPIISSLSAGSVSGSSNPNSSGSGSPSSGAGSTAPSVLAGSTGGNTPAGSGSTAGSGGTSAPLPGGMGGGPTGGSGGTSGGTTFPCVDASTGLSVTCTYQTCTPLLSLSSGQKAYLTTTGTCVIVN